MQDVNDLIVEATKLDWMPYDLPGATPHGFELKMLNPQLVNGAVTALLRMAPGATLPRHIHERTTEIDYILEGDFVYEGVSYGPGSMFARGAGVPHGPLHTEGGCTMVLIMTNAANPTDAIELADIKYV